MHLETVVVSPFPFVTASRGIGKIINPVMTTKLDRKFTRSSKKKNPKKDKSLSLNLRIS